MVTIGSGTMAAEVKYDSFKLSSPIISKWNTIIPTIILWKEQNEPKSGYEAIILCFPFLGSKFLVNAQISTNAVQVANSGNSCYYLYWFILPVASFVIMVRRRLQFTNNQAPVVQRVDNTSHWINHHPLDDVLNFDSTSPLNSDLSILWKTRARFGNLTWKWMQLTKFRFTTQLKVLNRKLCRWIYLKLE